MMNRVALDERELMNVTGGNSLKDSPEYQIIKNYYINKGIDSAIILALYCCTNTKDAYEIIRMIGEEVDGN